MGRRRATFVRAAIARHDRSSSATCGNRSRGLGVGSVVNRLRGLGLLLLGIVLAACTAVHPPTGTAPATPAGPSSSPTSAPSPTTATVGSMAFLVPPGWHVVRPRSWVAPTGPALFLSNAPIDDPCPTSFRGTACLEPLAQLPPDGILVMFTSAAAAALSVSAPSLAWFAPGSPVPIAVGTSSPDSPCTAMGGEVEAQTILRDFEVTACLRGPGLAAGEAMVQALIDAWSEAAARGNSSPPTSDTLPAASPSPTAESPSSSVAAAYPLAPPVAIQAWLAANLQIGFRPLTAAELALVRIAPAQAEQTVLAVPGPGYGFGTDHFTWTKVGCVFLGYFTAEPEPSLGYVPPTYPAYLVQVLARPAKGYAGQNIEMSPVDARTGERGMFYGWAGSDGTGEVLGTTCGTTP